MVGGKSMQPAIRLIANSAIDFCPSDNYSSLSDGFNRSFGYPKLSLSLILRLSLSLVLSSIAI